MNICIYTEERRIEDARILTPYLLDMESDVYDVWFVYGSYIDDTCMRMCIEGARGRETRAGREGCDRYARDICAFVHYAIRHLCICDGHLCICAPRMHKCTNAIDK